MLYTSGDYINIDEDELKDLASLMDIVYEQTNDPLIRLLSMNIYFSIIHNTFTKELNNQVFICLKEMKLNDEIKEMKENVDYFLKN